MIKGRLFFWLVLHGRIFDIRLSSSLSFYPWFFVMGCLIDCRQTGSLRYITSLVLWAFGQARSSSCVLSYAFQERPIHRPTTPLSKGANGDVGEIMHL
jgi:hypothetical protein